MSNDEAQEAMKRLESALSKARGVAGPHWLWPILVTAAVTASVGGLGVAVHSLQAQAVTESVVEQHDHTIRANTKAIKETRESGIRSEGHMAVIRSQLGALKQMAEKEHGR
jgi:hypothetical protein